MNAAEFARGITFRRYGPDSALPGYARLSATLARRGDSLEMRNTRLPAHEPALRERLRHLLRIPRMSTFAIGSIINVAVAAMPTGSIFLNIGVWHGFTLLAGMAGNTARASVGVDDFSQFGGPRGEFLQRFESAAGPSDAFYDLGVMDYFAHAHAGRRIGFYVYDAGHRYDDQLNGLALADPFLAPGALILVDDTNWVAPRRATVEFVHAYADRYKVVTERTTAANRHPTFWNGLMLIERL